MTTPQSDTGAAQPRSSPEPASFASRPYASMQSTEPGLPGTGEDPSSQTSIIRVRLPEPWALALWLLIVLRVGLQLAGLASAQFAPPFTTGGGAWYNLILRGRGAIQLLSIWQRWDALWYQQIAEHGYHAGDNTVHFQPLFPLLSRIVSVPLAGHIVVAELVISSAAFFGAMWLLYHLARLDVDAATAQLALLLVAFFPVAFFFVAPYTESLYLLVTVAALWFARRGQPWAAGLAGFAASMSRTLGILIVLPLAFEYLRQRRATGKRPGLGFLASGLPAFGYVALLAYQRYVIGEMRSPVQVASAWGDRSARPWDALAASWNYIVSTGSPMEVLNLASLLLFGFLAVYVARRLPLIYGAYVVPYVVLMFSRETMSSPLGAVSRYMLVLFPCFIALAMLLRPHWRLAAGWLVVGGMLQVVYFLIYIHFGFVA